MDYNIACCSIVSNAQCTHAERVTISRYLTLAMLAIVSLYISMCMHAYKACDILRALYILVCQIRNVVYTQPFFAVTFADQFLSVATSLPQNYNIYGLGEHKTPLRLKCVPQSSKVIIICILTHN